MYLCIYLDHSSSPARYIQYRDAIGFRIMIGKLKKHVLAVHNFKKPKQMNFHCISLVQSNSKVKILTDHCQKLYLYRGSPTYTVSTNTVSTNTIFGLCTCKWGN